MLSCFSTGCVNASPNQGGSWAAKEADGVYHALERGRAVKLVEIMIQETSTPFNPVMEVLAEPCDSARECKHPSGLVPCWPRDERQRTQALLARFATQSPDYRYKRVLLHAARYLNRDVGTFRRAWIVGTSPLAVAFLQSPPNTPVGGAGGVGERDAQLVTAQDLDAQADVLLVFPTELVLATNGLPGTEQIDARLRARICHFSERLTLRRMVLLLIDAAELERAAAHVVEVPVQ
jgi:hypothetical protein